MFQKSTIKRGLLVGISFLSGLMIANIYLEISNQTDSKKTVNFDVKARIAAAERMNIQYDKRGGDEFLIDEGALESKIAYVMCSNTVFTQLPWDKPYIPLSGIPNMRTIFGNENGYYATFQSDRFGFNNPDRVWDAAAKGKKIDVLLVGASFEQGFAVNREDSIAGQLSKNGLSVINLACAANGALSNLAALREYAANLNIKNIVYVYSDVEHLKRFGQELKIPILQNYLYRDNFSQNLKGNYKKIGKEIKIFHDSVLLPLNLAQQKVRYVESIKQAISKPLSPSQRKQHLKKTIIKNRELEERRHDNPTRRIFTGYHIRTLIRNFLSSFYDPNIVDLKSLSDNIPLLSKVFNKMNAFANEKQARLLIIFQPSRKIIEKIEDRRLERSIKKGFGLKPLLIDAIEKSGAELIDLETVLNRVTDLNKLYPLGGRSQLGHIFGHFGKKGYNLVANEILDKLRKGKDAYNPNYSRRNSE